MKRHSEVAGVCLNAVRPRVSHGGSLPVDGVFPAGQMVGLLGPNGAGKSTLLKAMAGCLPHDGVIRVDGRPLTALSRQERARLIGYLPQDHTLHWPLTVRRMVSLGRLPHGEMSETAPEVEQALRETDLLMLAERRVPTLSGGERARAHLARVLAGEPRVLLADEPVAALDPAHQVAVLALLRRQARRLHRAVVVVLHDLSLAARFCDQVVLLDRGQVVVAGPPSQVMADVRLAQVYETDFLIGALEEYPVVLPLGAMA